MKRISIQQPIINAIEETDPSLSRFQNQMLKWAKYIEREIGSKNAYKYKSALFTVDGCTIDLPDDCYKAVMLLSGDYTEECNARYIGMEWPVINTDAREDSDDDDSSWLWYPAEASYVNENLWEEVAEQLQLVSRYDGKDMTLIYQYIETDSNGFWLINESHEEAIMKFIKYKISHKYNWKMFKSDKLLRQGHLAFMKELERDYNIAIRHARAVDGETTPFEKEQY